MNRAWTCNGGLSSMACALALLAGTPCAMAQFSKFTVIDSGPFQSVIVRGLSADGTTLVGDGSPSLFSDGRAFRRRFDGPTENLGVLSGSFFTSAEAANGTGSMVVGRQSGGGFVWVFPGPGAADGTDGLLDVSRDGAVTISRIARRTGGTSLGLPVPSGFTEVSAARLAGSILREHVEKTLSVDAATQHDLKLEVDRLCDDAIRKKLSATYPAHSILTEESGQTTGLSPYQWIVDPLDGTVNYFHRIPYYCTSIACYRTPAQPAAGLGEPLIAVVYSPADDEMYTAVRNQGAFVNGTRLSTPAVSDLSQALVCTTHGSSPETKAQMQLSLIHI